MDLGEEGRRGARRLGDPNRVGPGQPAIGGLREADLGGATGAEATVLPDRVEVAVDRVGRELGEKVAGAHRLAGDRHVPNLLDVDGDGPRPAVAAVSGADDGGGESRAT